MHPGQRDKGGGRELGPYRQGAILFPAVAVILGQFGLFEEDDGLFAVSHVCDEDLLFRCTPPLLLWGYY